MTPRPIRPLGTLTVIAPLGAPGRRPRLEKTIRAAADLGFDVSYWGWRRSPREDLGENLPSISSRSAILSGGSYGSKLGRALYPIWTLAVFLRVLITRPRYVYALGLETAAGVWLASQFTGTKYVFDDADRLLLLFNFPRWFSFLVERVEIQTSRSSIAHIIPGFARYDYRTNSMTMISNLPDRGQVQEATSRAIRRPRAALVVYINGWLAPARGLHFLKGVAEALITSDIIFLVAAKTDTPEAAQLTKLPNVNYLGSLSQIDALSWYKAADLVATFYDPKVRINRFAEPNKWGDAICMGTPILVNSEVETATSLISEGAAFAVNYGDVNDCTTLLRHLAGDPSSLATAREVVISIRPRYRYFDDAMNQVLGLLAKSREPVVN